MHMNEQILVYNLIRKVIGSQKQSIYLHLLLANSLQPVMKRLKQRTKEQ